VLTLFAGTLTNRLGHRAPLMHEVGFPGAKRNSGSPPRS